MSLGNQTLIQCVSRFILSLSLSFSCLLAMMKEIVSSSCDNDVVTFYSVASETLRDARADRSLPRPAFPFHRVPDPNVQSLSNNETNDAPIGISSFISRLTTPAFT